MWKLLSVFSLILCMFAMADETPRGQSVSVECCGRLRHGIVAIGGETTGTTITINRIVWELQLPDDASREFAKHHHKEPVIVTGRLRKVSGIEVKDRWIIDVRTLSECDATKDAQETRLTIQGTLRIAESRQSDSSGMTIEADSQVWSIDFSTDAKLRSSAESLIGRPVLLTGSLKHGTDEDPEAETDAPLVVHVKNLKQSVIVPVRGEQN